LTAPENLLARARALQGEGNVQLALHLADFVVSGTGDQAMRTEAMLLKADLLDSRAESTGNYIAGNIMRTSAGLLRAQAGQKSD
jgi:hypothetical protein